jgi:hypothetical protein
MRIALALLFIISISCPLLLKLGIVGYYEYNRAYIAKNLCENRNKPELKCCGKCYLRKQLAKVDNGHSAEKPLLAQLSKFEMAPFVVPHPVSLTHTFLEESRQECHYIAPFPKEITLSIFHPPG